jgi:hypothetical protein
LIGFGDWKRDREETGLVSASGLDAKATQAAREAQNLVPAQAAIEAMKKADGLRHAADTYKLTVNSNGHIERNFGRQPPRGQGAHFVKRIVVAAFCFELK